KLISRRLRRILRAASKDRRKSTLGCGEENRDDGLTTMETATIAAEEEMRYDGVVIKVFMWPCSPEHEEASRGDHSLRLRPPLPRACVHTPKSLPRRAGSARYADWEAHSVEESRDCVEAEEREVQTIRDVVFTKEKSKSAKLRSKIVKKILPKKLRSYKKNRKMKLEEKERAVEVVEEEEELLTEVSSLYSEDIMESKVSEGDEIGSNPPLLEICEEIEEEESKGDLTKAIVMMIVIALAGLLSGKVVAIGLTLFVSDSEIGLLGGAYGSTGCGAAERECCWVVGSSKLQLFAYETALEAEH
ncbi:hypothetical protein HID58_090585, partial [Brassica napus]